MSGIARWLAALCEVLRSAPQRGIRIPLVELRTRRNSLAMDQQGETLGDSCGFVIMKSVSSTTVYPSE